MGIFNKKSSEIVPVSTRLDAQWFSAWLDDIFSRTGKPKTQEATLDLLEKADRVIDHFSRPLIAESCDRSVLEKYTTYHQKAMAWDLISFVAGCQSSDPKWVQKVVDSSEKQLRRFADIYVDPSIAQ